MTNITGITVKELLEADFMSNADVLAGKKGLENIIQKVNVMEVPDIVDWVEEGELLLTTAYVIKDDPDKLYDLVIELHQKGVAGLGIKTHRYIKEVPSYILEEADKRGFPLIKLPYELSHSTVIANSLTKIIGQQTELLERIDRVQNKLLNTMLRGGGLGAIGKVICESLEKSTLAIREYVFEENIIFCNEKKKEALEEILKKDRESGNEYELYMENDFRHFETVDNLNGEKVKRYTIPICTQDRNFGAIYIWDSDQRLTSLEIRMIKSSSSIIALEILKKLSMFEIESKYKIEFFDDLFSKNNMKQNRALERAAYFDFDKNLSYSAIVISISEHRRHKKGEQLQAHLMHKVNIRILGLVQRLIYHHKQNMICGNKSDKIIILYGSSKEGDSTALKKEILSFCNEIIHYSDLEAMKHIQVGIGRNYKDPKALWRSYREAKRAIRGMEMDDKKRIAHYADLGIYKLLTYDELEPELQEFYRDILKLLVEYDKEKNTELVPTLKMYFRLGGNLKKISKEMYTHYNTIIYRVQRIEEITGTNLENYDDRLNLQIALKIYDIIDEEKV
ncbi:PucR family transcriptional regulator [Tindallia californiensis]|uniref:Purine catabolism regulatory protein n=1 Tax=Tindallia californiensis TaxID=159292 RepID=A0A1H3PSW2_9FIRM|nr:PucR family transcriptional regulator [Tindallia californiensis]SDZ04197.1 purine catabolism regulatory protein [Tindallia californiensis]